MCLVYHTLFADETTPTPKSDAHLYGHVIDSKTGEHLPYATVTIPGTTIGTMTDASGHYFLKNLPTGTITVEARMMSYDPVRHEVTLKKGQSLELNFEITENGITMDDVVVSASRSETTRRKAPALVNVLDRKIFDNTNSACLAQGLGFQPGVRVEDDCQNCGFMQVRINGLDGHYSQILVDSHPVFSALSGVYGLEQIPASMIDRVEVMRGGGSALFGSSAIGGTINIITKDPDRNSAEVGHTITAIGNSSSYDNVTSANASLVTDSLRRDFMSMDRTATARGTTTTGTASPKFRNCNPNPSDCAHSSRPALIRVLRSSTIPSWSTAGAATGSTCRRTKR